MIRFPNNRRFAQSNQPYYGSLYYSRGISLDEEGKIVLSPRSVSIENNEDVSAFSLPLAIGVRRDGQYYFVTASNPWTADLRAGNDVSAAEDTDSDGDSPPDFGIDAHGVWWQTRWYVTDTAVGDILMYKTVSNGNWTDTAVALTDGVRHPLAVFQSRQTLCIGDGNDVLQVNTSHAASTTLTIQSDFEITKLAYNNEKMAVATKTTDTTGQNNEAYLFIWNGATTAANQSYGVGAPFILDVVPYKSSFALLTNKGQLWYFNGGGLQLLGNLPIWFAQREWLDNDGATAAGNPMALGDIMSVDGDRININLNGSHESFGANGEEYLPTMPGGIWTYDPRVGLYHRISPSISEASYITVANTSVNISTNTLTISGGVIPSTGSPIKYLDDPQDKIGGLTIGTVYYCIKVDASNFRLATTYDNAIAGTAVDITAQQSAGSAAFLGVEFKDYGQSFNYLAGAVKTSPTFDLARDKFVFGANLLDSNSTTSYNHLLFTARGFQNIGYFVLSKIFPEQVEDSFNKVYIKHDRLKTDEYIQVKYQPEQLTNLPITTPQHGTHCTWSDNNTFTTTANLADAKKYLDAGKDLECEIIAGAGAGQMLQISSITESNGTYTVNLDGIIYGVSASDICDVKIENWTAVPSRSKTNTNVSTFSIGKVASSMFIKVIMKGEDIGIEEVQVVNGKYKPST